MMSVFGEGNFMFKTFVRLGALRAFVVMSFSSHFALKNLIFSAKTGMTARNTGRKPGMQVTGNGKPTARNWKATGGQLPRNRHAESGERVGPRTKNQQPRTAVGRDIPTKTPPTTTPNHPNHLPRNHLPSPAPRVADGRLMAPAVHLLAHDRHLLASSGHLFVAPVHPKGGSASPTQSFPPRPILVLSLAMQPSPESIASRPATLRWSGSIDGQLEILDQRLLPTQVVVLNVTTVEQVWDAIKTLAVRGAPAIGVAAAYGMFIAARSVPPASQAAALIDLLRAQGEYLKSSRPTAVNLEWAVTRMLAVAIAERGIGVRRLIERLLEEANLICREDAEKCLAIGRHGASFIRDGMGILTHCNAGSLATADHGTALAPMYEALRNGIKFSVFSDETRPLLQGSRLTAWELQAAGVDVTVICDNMAGLVMKQKKVQLVIVGADRIAANGDTANKIGTYSVAQLARAHNIPFVVAAPCNTFDLTLRSGDQIPIEERAPSEITHSFGTQTAPSGIKTYNPAFDVTPASLITALITERGVIQPVTDPNIRVLVEK